MSKKYSVKPKISENLVEQLLHNRGVRTEKEKQIFLNPDFEKHLHDPFLLPDMKKVVKRILEAIDKGERVGIWSDYDADGIPGGVLLHDFFKLIGFNNFINYIPNRHTEGYGLNIEGIKELKKDKVEILITIDCGIRDNKVIDHANKGGIEVIVTDHHEEGEKIPKAFAIINPKIKKSKYPEKILCGTGVIWKLIQAILITKRDFIKDGQPFELPHGKEKWLLDLVGIATLSDMVPLVGENRALSHFGLRVLRKSRRPGLRKLYSMLRIIPQNLNEDDIGFLISPRINAASRMGHPRDAFNLLVAESEADAESTAKHLDSINNERKGLVASMVKEIKKHVKEKFQSTGEKPLIVTGDPKWRPALLGLAANSIAEEYGRPVFLWGREGGDTIKGSCRSDGSTDLVAIMERAKDSFVEYGGHKFSGGFSVSYEKIHNLEEALLDASTHSVNKNLEVLVDAVLDISDVNTETANTISSLAPFGVGNEKPVFIFENVIPTKVGRFGKEKNHLEVVFENRGNRIRAIGFFKSPEDWENILNEGIKTNLVASIEKSGWNGRTEIRLRIVDFF
ncbi:MAG: single-stranded-DNA-specific exonuclease RecJ [Patescibacteria group bacterium]